MPDRVSCTGQEKRLATSLISLFTSLMGLCGYLAADVARRVSTSLRAGMAEAVPARVTASAAVAHPNRTAKLAP